MNRRKWYGVFLGAALGVLGSFLPVQAGTIYNSPYVSFSPDRKAWTTDAGNRGVKWYKDDGSDDVATGVKRTLSEPGPGEHYYAVKRTGSIPVSEWQVTLSYVNCCHTSYPSSGDYHGVAFTRKPCMQKHFSAWRPVCADCGKAVVYGHFYMSREAAESIGYLETGPGLCYYYLCPFNNNLEQGMDTREHICKAVSANRYRVVYDANAENYGGYMEPSFHMYGNSDRYEGRQVTPLTHLNPNTYTRIGWEFAGWNTEADGSGDGYGDEAEILNLCDGDYGDDPEAASVTLYALWRPSRGTLEIDPAGGSYDGTAGITCLYGSYGETYPIRTDRLAPPQGCLVTFDVQGGKEIDAVRGTMHFTGWMQEEPFGGSLRGERYTFCAGDGNVDRITAAYERDAVTLPLPVKENLSFGGWYYDKEFQRPAGGAGTGLTPARDMTLYAQWVELVLKAVDDYEANDGKGAVDLSWSQSDGQDKSYKLYQSRDGVRWEQIYDADDVRESVSWAKEYGYTHAEEAFQAPYTGFYRITAYGAAGGDYGEFTGGLGGMVSGSFWLDRGETVSCCVAGQNGFNGGGVGKTYAGGGGYSVVRTKAGGILLLAGGGGGAGDCGDGFGGGLAQSLVAQGHVGEDGASGGGGGYLGGRAGEMTAHYHEEGVCNHVHEGDPSKSGGCYTIAVKCGETLTAVHTGSKKWYWGGSDEEYCPNCGADASLGETCSGHETDYYNHVCPVHGNRKSNTNKKTPTTCTVVVRYDVSCKRTEDYFCGYPYDGYVISAKPSYGGSSYVNSGAARSYEEESGVRAGDGHIQIVSEDIGYREDTALDAVLAQDLAAPGPIAPESVTKSPADKENISVQWREPADNGTVYYHRADSYAAGSEERISLSNITVNTLVSGIQGYWYCVDHASDTELSAGEGSFLSRAEVLIALTQEEQYLHVLAVDRAGNRGPVAHIPLGSSRTGSEDVKWPVLTEQLSLQQGDNVYPAEADKTYYVKADGATPVVLAFGAYLQGPAAWSYQPNYAILESLGKSGNPVRASVHVPSRAINDGGWQLAAGALRFSSDGEGYFRNGDYVTAVRSLGCRRLAVVQELLPDRAAHGRTIPFIPIAGVEYHSQVIYSDYDADQANGLWIIGDGEAPEIYGMELLENLTLLDRRQNKISLRVTAQDQLSGLRELYLEIENLDNGCIMRYAPDEQGVVAVDICADEPIFSGDFHVTAYAVDNVGNERQLSYGTTEFDLRAEITRVLEPHEPRFKRGESGCLHITSWGYADRVEVEFPEEFAVGHPALNQVYVYEADPMYKREEALDFVIPLYVPEREAYTVTVRAYKGDRLLEAYPALTVLGVDGTVLDELRTRLR